MRTASTIRKAALTRITTALSAFLLCAILIAGAARADSSTSQTAGTDIEPAVPVDGTVTYQGRLTESGNPANGQYDFRFTLFDALSGGNAQGTYVHNNQTVSNGLFTVSLDLYGHVTGDARYLQIEVKPAGGPSYTLLSPRQALTAVPYALSLQPGASIKASGAYPILFIENLSGPGLTAYGNSSSAPALKGTNNGTNGTGVSGVANGGTIAKGVSGESASGYGGYFVSTTGVGVSASGYDGVSGTSTAADGYGVRGTANGGANARGVAGITTSGTGVYGTSSASNGTGTQGIANTGTSAKGVNGSSSSGYGVYGSSTASNGTGTYGVANTGSSAAGVRGDSTAGRGVYGTSSTGYGGHFTSSTGTGVNVAGGNGVYSLGTATNGVGLWGVANTGSSAKGVYGSSSTGVGLYGVSTANNGTGIYGESNSGSGAKGIHGSTSNDEAYGVLGTNSGSTGFATGAGVRGHGTYSNGVDGVSTYRYGVDAYGGSAGIVADSTDSGWAGQFLGDVDVWGSCCGAGEFYTRIDHPLDPENKYLHQALVQSPDLLSVINGNVTTSAAGEATVRIPDYFQDANTDFRYTLTVIGQFAQAIVSKKLEAGTFTIKTDKPNVEVSWQVTGIRSDPYALANPIQPETPKSSEEQGKYAYPDLYNQPKSKGVNYELESRHDSQP